MTYVENLHEDKDKIAFSVLNIGDVFESRGNIYIKYYDDAFEETYGLQIYPPNNSQFYCENFAADELVSERQCKITIE